MNAKAAKTAKPDGFTTINAEPAELAEKRRSTLVLVVVSMSAALALSCAPSRVWTVPEMKGVIRQGAEPVPDVVVVWVAWELQEDGKTVPHERARARTDARGEFTMTAVSRIVWETIPLGPAHSISRWDVALDDGEHRRVLWHQMEYRAGPRSTPARVSIECDTELANPCSLLKVERSRLQPKRGLPVQ